MLPTIFAAGWLTDMCLRMVAPSLVMMTSPEDVSICRRGAVQSQPSMREGSHLSIACTKCTQLSVGGMMAEGAAHHLVHAARAKACADGVGDGCKGKAQVRPGVAQWCGVASSVADGVGRLGAIPLPAMMLALRTSSCWRFPESS